jgi:hypothetical protein
MRNWVYYMQQGLQGMWKKKEVSEPRVVDDAGVDIKTGKYVGDPGYTVSWRPPTRSGPYVDSTECDCLPDCGCK